MKMNEHNGEKYKANSFLYSLLVKIEIKQSFLYFKGT